MKKMILTFCVSQWYSMPDAMKKMAQVVHGEGVSVTWLLNYETALVEKEILDQYHQEYGDELIMIPGKETILDWKKLFPWSQMNCVGCARPTTQRFSDLENEKIDGIWGYCDQQIGPDGITHWGCPWGLFYVSPKSTMIPPQANGRIVGVPWTLRDLHKCYHLKQAITFSTDPIDQIRAKTLDWGTNITIFQDLFDELLVNLNWNERIYCCLHEEANGPFIYTGKDRSDEGATPEESEAMYEMIRLRLRYAKKRGATLTTVPEAVAEFKKLTSKGITLPSTLLTHDKFHGSMVHYVQPMPPGVPHKGLSSAGHFPDTLFHFDNECQLVFVHPETMPKQVLNYKAQYFPEGNRPYPQEQVLPNLLDWKTKREGDTRTYHYTIQSWYSMPYGIAEWGDFRGWQVENTNGLWAKIIDDRVLLLRCNLEAHGDTAEQINEAAVAGFTYWVSLRANR
jgi:hypothetical protein